MPLRSRARGLTAHQPLVSDQTYVLSGRLWFLDSLGVPGWGWSVFRGDLLCRNMLCQLWFWNRIPILILLKEKLSFSETRKTPVLWVVRQPLLASRNLKRSDTAWQREREGSVCLLQLVGLFLPLLKKTTNFYKSVSSCKVPFTHVPQKSPRRSWGLYLHFSSDVKGIYVLPESIQLGSGRARTWSLWLDVLHLS